LNKKIIIIFVTTLLIATTVLPAVGKINEKMYPINDTLLPPSTAWRKTFGGNEFDHFHSVRQDKTDGGYFACGLTEESNEYYVWLLKVDSNGNEVWSKINYDLNGTYLTNTEMWISAFDVIETSDNGFLVSGVSMFGYEYEDGILWLPTGYFWKTDYKGDTEWMKHYYELDIDENIIGTFGLYWLYSVIEVEDGFVSGGMLINHNVSSGEIIDFNGSILKTDFSGNKLWYTEYDNCFSDQLCSITKTSDEGYFLGGCVEGDEFEGGYALWMVKTEEDGELDWEQIYDGPEFEYTAGKGFYETSDGGYIMNGVSNSYCEGLYNYDVWVIKTDKNGDEDWTKTYGEDKADYCWGMCEADNNGFALGICLDWAGMDTDADICIIETDENGNVEWISSFENEGHQETRAINPTDDGGYIVGGMTSTEFGDPECDAILYKIYPFDNERPSKPTISGPRNVKANREYTYTASSTDPDNQQLFYMWDWGDGSYSEWLDSPRATHSWSDPKAIRVLVKDFYGYESEWSELYTTKPYNKALDIPIFDFLNSHPILFQLLQRYFNF
jgi:hypothetical protein